MYAEGVFFRRQEWQIRMDKMKFDGKTLAGVKSVRTCIDMGKTTGLLACYA